MCTWAPVSVPPMMNAIFRARHSDKAGDRQRANAMIFLIGGGGGSARSIAFPVGLTPPATTTTTTTTTTTLTDSLLSGSLLSSPAICTITIGNGKFLDRRRCRCFVWTISSRRLNWQTEKSPTHLIDCAKRSAKSPGDTHLGMAEFRAHVVVTGLVVAAAAALHYAIGYHGDPDADFSRQVACFLSSLLIFAP